MPTAADDPGNTRTPTGGVFGVIMHEQAKVIATPIPRPKVERPITKQHPIPHDDTRPRASARTGDVVSDDRLCPKCKYNIRGLPIGGVCPECGTAIIAAPSGFGSRGELPIEQAPKAYMKLLETGFVLLAFGGIGGVAVNVMLFLGGMDKIRGFIMSGACLIGWTVGVLLVVRPRPLAEARKPGEIEWKWLRRAAVGTSLGALALVILSVAIGMVWSPGVVIAGILHQVFALAALCTTAVYASFLCDWASDTGLADRLRAMVWVIVFSALVMVVAVLTLRFGPEGLRGFAFIGVVLSTLVFAIATIVVNIAWLQAISMTSWAQRNAKAAMEREIRRAERRRREDAERLKYVDHSPLPAGMDPAARDRFDAMHANDQQRESPRSGSAPDTPRPGQSTHRIKPGEGLNPYDIED